MKRKEVAKWVVFSTLTLILIVSLTLALGLLENTVWEANLTDVRFSAVVSTDLDRDNLSDIILTGCLNDGADDCENGVIAKVYTNNGTVLIDNASWGGNLTGIGRGSLSLGDLNNDGLIDLVLTGCTSAQDLICNGAILTRAYINNGTSLVVNSSWQQNISGIYRGSSIIGDINNDGRPDLILNGMPTTTSQTARVYINNGSALVSDSTWQSNLTALKDGNMDLGDLNNDGWLDLLMTGRDINSNDHTSVYINNGSTFTENAIWEQNLTGIQTTLSSLSLGDFDNDGDLDMIFMGIGDYLYLYANNLSTLLLNQTDASEGGIFIGMYKGSLGWGDYDNDGDLDLVAIGREETYDRVYRNNNTIFEIDASASQDIKSDDLSQCSLIWVDVNNDTKLDIISAGVSSGILKSRVYINNGTMNNSLPSAPSSFQNYTTGNRVFFGWGLGSDTETNSTGLYYNLRIGTGNSGNDIASGVFGGSSGGGGESGGAPNGYFGNMMQRRNVTLPLSRFQANTNYYWSVQTIDTGLAKSAWSEEQVFTTSSDITFPTIIVHEPDDGLHTNSSTISFVALAVDNNNITNVTLWANFTGTFALNVTNSSAYNNTNYTFTKILADGHYQWAIRACDALNNCNSSLNRTLNVDTTAPSVSLSTPSNATTWTSSNTVTFTWSTTETNPSNCTLYVSDTSKGTTSASTLSTSLSNGAYTWYISCTDLANNQARSSATRALTVSYTAPPGDTTTSSGGGGGTTFTSKFDADLSKTEEKSITGIKGTTRTFTLDGTTQHKITIIDLTKDQATITIESTPITIILQVGETKKIDIDRDGNKDIAITLNSIISGNAVITIKKLPPPTKPAEQPKEETAKPKILFDIKIKPLQKTYFPGEQLQAEIELTNLGTVGKVDVQLNYILYNEKGEITAQHQDIRAVDTVTSFIQTLQIPENTPTGTYQLNVTAQYQNTTNQYSAQIQIQTKIRYIPSWIQKNYKLITISSIGIVLAIIAIILFFRLKKREEKIEKEIRKLKEKIRKK